MRLRESIAPLAAASTLFVTGCGSEQSKSSVTSNSTNTAPSTAITPAEYYAGINSSLNIYRGEVLVRHEARILLDTCIAWQNKPGSVSVTLNPGVAEANFNGPEVSYFVASTDNSDYTPPWGPINGPPIDAGKAKGIIYPPNHNQLPPPDVVNVSLVEHTDKTGQSYYEDAQNSQPVLDTVVVSGAFTISAVEAVCDSLRNHTPLPGSA